MTKSQNGHHKERRDPHWVEWATGIVSAFLVAGMLGWIGWEAFTREATAPALSIRLLTQQQGTAGYSVTFDIYNGASTTAAGVTVVGSLSDAGNVIEESRVTFDYVPAESKTTGALIFKNAPSDHRLDIRPTGFTAP